MSIFTSKSFKSIFLAVLMVTMSLSAGIVELHRSPLADANDVAAVGAGCAFITRASGEAIYVDPVNGSDAWDVPGRVQKQHFLTHSTTLLLTMKSFCTAGGITKTSLSMAKITC